MNCQFAQFIKVLNSLATINRVVFALASEEREKGSEELADVTFCSLPKE